MKFYRLYTGDDGKSHLEGLDSSQASKLFNRTRPAKGVLFGNDFAPHIVDWHRVRRQRWVITLAGIVDIGLRDGTTTHFGRGDVFLAEDTTGQGQTAMPRDWVRAYMDVDYVTSQASPFRCFDFSKLAVLVSRCPTRIRSC